MTSWRSILLEQGAAASAIRYDVVSWSFTFQDDGPCPVTQAVHGDT